MVYTIIIRAAQWIWNQLIDCFITSPLTSHLNWSCIRNKISIFVARIGFGRRAVLYELKSFRQARERTYLHWPSDAYPCRMKMKEAGWFIAHNKDNELVAVCLYCKKVWKQWHPQHDPYKVHKILSTNCPFVLYAGNIPISSPLIVKSIPRRRRVCPSLDKMAILPERMNTFRRWPHFLPHPPFAKLADNGLFYTGRNKTVKCFSCQGQMEIRSKNVNLMSAHNARCKYAKHLRDQSPRVPLNIQMSDKTYRLIAQRVDNTTFYFLQSTSTSTPGILLSVVNHRSNRQGLISSDNDLKRLRPCDKLQQEVNWVTGSDGPLVNILQGLANSPIDLTHISTEGHSSSQTHPTSVSEYQCKTCLSCDATPHIVPIQCCHLGLCSKECSFKWTTCVICGYTLGKAIRIYDV